MYRNRRLKNIPVLEGGTFFNDGYEKVRNSKLLSSIVIIIIVILVIYLIYKIWSYIYKKQQETKCVPSKGCTLLSGVKNGTSIVTIKADKMPPSIHGNDYTMCIWLYVRSNNFGSNQRPWKTVMYRGGNLDGNSKPDGWHKSDEQYSVQPGVWLGGDSNRLLIRWETLGRVSNVSPCCNSESCSKEREIGKRCMKEDDTIRFCGRDHNGNMGWQKEPKNAYSMNPYVNPPNKLCSAHTVDNQKIWNTMNCNTSNETCIDNVPLDRWFHLAISTHTQSADVYVDGKLVTTMAFNSPPVPLNGSDLVLCKDSTNSVSSMGRNGFLGALTQIRYFNMALSPYDILKIYSWGPHPFEVANPENLKKELESIGGSIQVSSKMSSDYDDARLRDF